MAENVEKRVSIGKAVEAVERDAQYQAVFGDVSKIIDVARESVTRSVNAAMTAAYWLIGRRVVEFEQPGDELPESCVVIGDYPAFVRRAPSDVHLGLGYIDAYIDRFLCHENLLPVTGPSLRDTGLASPGNCSGSAWRWYGDPCLTTVSDDQGRIGLPHLTPHL